MQEQNNINENFPDKSQVTMSDAGSPIPNQSASTNAGQGSNTQGQTQSKLPTDATHIVSDGDSRAVANQNEGSWPPPNIRDEIAESAKQVETEDQKGQS